MDEDRISEYFIQNEMRRKMKQQMLFSKRKTLGASTLTFHHAKVEIVYIKQKS